MCSFGNLRDIPAWEQAGKVFRMEKYWLLNSPVH